MCVKGGSTASYTQYYSLQKGREGGREGGTEGQRDREKGRERLRERERERGREREREREIERERERERERLIGMHSRVINFIMTPVVPPITSLLSVHSWPLARQPYSPVVGLTLCTHPQEPTRHTLV